MDVHDVNMGDAFVQNGLQNNENTVDANLREFNTNKWLYWSLREK